MPQTIKDADGNDVEVFSADEAAAQVQEKVDAAVAAAKEAHELEKEELENKALEKDEALADAQEKLKKAEEKELNFKALRDKSGKPDKEALEKAQAATDEVKAIKETLAEIQKQPFETAKATFIKNNIGADKELGEKYDFFFKKLSVGAKTMEEFNIALASAFTLATGGAKQPNLDSRIIITGVNDNFDGSGNKAETQDSQNFGALLGLTADDKKQFAPSKNNTVPIFAQTPPKDNK